MRLLKCLTSCLILSRTNNVLQSSVMKFFMCALWDMVLEKKPCIDINNSRMRFQAMLFLVFVTLFGSSLTKVFFKKAACHIMLVCMIWQTAFLRNALGRLLLSSSIYFTRNYLYNKQTCQLEYVNAW